MPTLRRRARVWVDQKLRARRSRNRRPVIESYLEHRCDVGELRAVRVLNVCQGVDGEAVPPREYARDCATGGTP